MSYIKQTWLSQSGNCIIVDKYHSIRATPRNPKNREKRMPKTGVTTIRQLRINIKQRTDKTTRLIIDNFVAGDYLITFTLANELGVEECKIYYKKFLRKLRTFAKKRGIVLKYIAVLENVVGQGRLHGHILLSHLTDSEEMQQLLKQAWPLGTCNTKTYNGQIIDAKRIASYLTKEEALLNQIRDKEAEFKNDHSTPEDKKAFLTQMEAEMKSGRSYICVSKNLIRTMPKKEKVKRFDTFSDDIRPPKGYQIIKRLSGSGYTASGYPWQQTFFERTGSQQSQPWEVRQPPTPHVSVAARCPIPLLPLTPTPS